MANRSSPLILFSIASSIMTTIFPAMPPPPQKEIAQAIQAAQQMVGRWRWEKTGEQHELNQYIAQACLLAKAHLHVILFQNALQEFNAMVHKTHDYDTATRLGDLVNVLKNKARVALTELPSGFPQIKQQADVYLQILNDSQPLIEKLFIQISITSQEAQGKLEEISQKIEAEELSPLSVQNYGDFIQRTFEEIIATKDLAVISILMQKLAEKCSMNLDMLEILCVNFYINKHGEKEAEENLPELPAEAPAEGEEGGEAPPPPPPPDIDLYAGKEAKQSVQELITQRKAEKPAEGKEEGKKPSAQRPDLTAALQARKPLRHVEVAPKTSEGKQPQQITQLSKGQGAHELTIEDQIKKVNAQIAKIPTEIQRLEEKIATTQATIQELQEKQITIQKQFVQKNKELADATKEPRPEIQDAARAHDHKITAIKAELINLQKQVVEIQTKLDLPQKLAAQKKILQNNLELQSRTLADLKKKTEKTMASAVEEAINKTYATTTKKEKPIAEVQKEAAERRRQQLEPEEENEGEGDDWEQ